MDIKVIRATKTAEQAGAYYVRIQAMARKYNISLETEFDEHDTPDTKYIVLLDGIFPVATCRLYAIDESSVMLGRIVVLSEYRQKGLGSLVVREAEKWAWELGFTKSVIHIREQKVGFYKKLGYTADETKTYKGEVFTCVPMERNLT